MIAWRNQPVLQTTWKPSAINQRNYSLWVAFEYPGYIQAAKNQTQPISQYSFRIKNKKGIKLKRLSRKKPIRTAKLSEFSRSSSGDSESSMEAKCPREKAEDIYEKENQKWDRNHPCANNFGSESIILKNYDKRRDLNVPDTIGTQLYIKPMAKLLSEKMILVHFLFSGISTTKVDWEIMVDELSWPQTTPFDGIIWDKPPQSNGGGPEVQ